MTTNKATAKKQMSVAEYLTGAIGLSGKTQRTITEEIGYDNPNILTMFKQGKSKLPINKVGVLASSLGVDPTNLLRLVMTEYMPDAWEVINSIVGNKIVSAEERKLLKLIADKTEGLGLDMDDEQLVADLDKAFGDHLTRLKRGLSAGAASVKRGRVAES